MKPREQYSAVLADMRKSMERNVTPECIGTVTIYLAKRLNKAAERYQGRPMREVKP